MRKLILGIAAATSLLGACATSYQSQSFSGGFTETQLDRNVFRVTFKGNGFTAMDRAEDLALLRSAELTLQHGFSHFAIVDGRQDASTSVVTTPTQTTSAGTATVYGNTAYAISRSTTTGGQTFFVRKPSSSNTIVCFSGKPEGNFMAYDAQFLMQSLKSKYDIK